MRLDRYEEIVGKRMAMCQAVRLDWTLHGSLPIGCQVVEGAFEPAELVAVLDSGNG